MDTSDQTLSELREQLKIRNLTLFMGAGISVDNNIPSWEKLVLSMYFSKISEAQLGGWRPFSNYLYSIAEWHLANSSEPLEITARKLHKYYNTGDNGGGSFIDDLYNTLYGALIDKQGNPFQDIDKGLLRGNNSTLDSVAKLCESRHMKNGSVISYNYDNLLEIALGDHPYQSIFNVEKLEQKKLPIYHVHGYVPLYKDVDGSDGDDIIFTEDQYHRMSGNPYNWSNLVQIQAMSNSVGLMIGLSLSDRNIRRLLDAVNKAPVQSSIYALLQIPDTSPPENRVLDEIHKNAIKYLDKFRSSGVKSSQEISSGAMFLRPGIKSSRSAIKSSRLGEKGLRYQIEIAAIIEQVKILDLEQQQFVLEELGVKPIWFENFSDIPGILNSIMQD